MKNKITVLLFMLSFSLLSFSQTIGDYVDVVYLNNGTVVKGVIVEQVPGQSVKIMTPNGTEYTYAIQEISRFTREAKAKNTTTYNTTTTTTTTNSGTTASCDKSKASCDKSKASCDKSKKCSDSKGCCANATKKGFTMNADVLLNKASSGLRVTPGYRFGRLGNIGLAVGLEAINHKETYDFPALTLNIAYSGEILNNKITPFYQLEAGYAFSLDRYGYNRQHLYSVEDLYTDRSVLDYGGPMGGLAFGVKFYTKKKISYKVAVDARASSNFSDTHSTVEGVETFTKDFDITPGIGLRFGIGF